MPDFHWAEANGLKIDSAANAAMQIPDLSMTTSHS
jgi:hypothetical protein